MYGPNEPEPTDFLTEMPPLPDTEFCIYGTVYADPNRADALEKFYEQTTLLAQSEPGTLMYCLGRDDKDRDVFYFFERYAGKKAFEAHTSQPLMEKLEEDKLIKGVTAKFVKAILPAVEREGKEGK